MVCLCGSESAPARKGEITAREAAEVRIHGFRKANGRPHVDGTTIPNGVTRVEHVYELTDQIRLFVASDLSPTQRGILQRVLQAARRTVKEQVALIREFAKSLDAAEVKNAAKRERAAAIRKVPGVTPPPRAR
jgi:hypothetical protein